MVVYKVALGESELRIPMLEARDAFLSFCHPSIVKIKVMPGDHANHSG